MQTVWFMLVAVMIALYVVLDGFDLGAGIVQLLVSRTEAERALVLRSIGPVWDGNEVWLLAGGGTLYFAFPALYASSFSGFYLPLMMVLWLLILRGISIEFRNHIDSLVWKPFWDAVFGGASALLAIFFGAALGNVVRGVPLDQADEFFLPLWTNFGLGKNVGILDWYTVLVAVTAFATLLVHGALWVALKTDGALAARARAAARFAWWALASLTVLITWASFAIQPRLQESFAARPWGYVFPLLAIVGLLGMRAMMRREMPAFLCSAVYIVGMLTSAAFGLYPYVLPSNADPRAGLTVYNAAAAPYGLKVGLAWFIPGMLLATAYFVYTYRNFAGKVTAEDHGTYSGGSR
ncbi:MAG TPA: cytochrome d ubiquinol oxidase subunit II [Bryobacteraceae bacterium]|nr:cytochrome d ubiquinol oxidase subunit II [Bryobacteraceae bacterium]